MIRVVGISNNTKSQTNFQTMNLASNVISKIDGKCKDNILSSLVGCQLR